jgi:hypothetical protein
MFIRLAQEEKWMQSSCVLCGYCIIMAKLWFISLFLIRSFRFILEHFYIQLHVECSIGGNEKREREKKNWHWFDCLYRFDQTNHNRQLSWRKKKQVDEFNSKCRLSITWTKECSRIDWFSILYLLLFLLIELYVS